jgi:membrane-associated phospholipid phosphatase
MLSKEELSCLLINLISLFLVFSTYNVAACSQNLQATDSINANAGFSNNANQNKNRPQKPSASFYKTDSVFSFQSKKGYIPSLLYNFGDQVTAPFKFKKKQLLMTSAAIGITVTLLHFDNDIDKWATVQKQKHRWVNKSSPVITQFGSTYGTISLVATGLIYAAIKDQKGIQTSLLATQAWITSGAWVQLIKHLTGREDPSASYMYSKMPGGKWWGPFAEYDQDLPVYKSISSFDAFPSGHTAAAFSIATVFATQYKDRKAIPVICYSAATLVGISRLIEHQHWASDVFVGGLIGYVCGKQVAANFNKTHNTQVTSLSSKAKIKSEFTFIQDGNQIGFYLRW